MTTLDTLLEEIRTGPSGMQIAAFFDFDGTLLPALVFRGVSPAYGLAGANLNFFRLGTVARRTLNKRRRAFADELREVRRYAAEVAAL